MIDLQFEHWKGMSSNKPPIPQHVLNDLYGLEGIMFCKNNLII